MTGSGVIRHFGSLIVKIGGLFKEPEPFDESDVRDGEFFIPAETNCPSCNSSDYWRTTRIAVTMYRCLNCGSRGFDEDLKLKVGGAQDGR